MNSFLSVSFFCLPMLGAMGRTIRRWRSTSQSIMGPYTKKLPSSSFSLSHMAKSTDDFAADHNRYRVWRGPDRNTSGALGPRLGGRTEHVSAATRPHVPCAWVSAHPRCSCFALTMHEFAVPASEKHTDAYGGVKTDSQVCALLRGELSWDSVVF